VPGVKRSEFLTWNDARKARTLIKLLEHGRWDQYFSLSANNVADEAVQVEVDAEGSEPMAHDGKNKGPRGGTERGSETAWFRERRERNRKRERAAKLARRKQRSK